MLLSTKNLAAADSNKKTPDLAGELGVPEKQLHRRLEINREKLFKVRNKRVHPFKDDKILTDWNGLMIAALARAGQVLNEPRYTADAVRAAAYVCTNFVCKLPTTDISKMLANLQANGSK